MTNHDAKSLGDRIKTARLAQQLSVRQLAMRAGLHHGYIARLESGEKTNPSTEALQKIADALSIDVQQILSGRRVKSERAAPRAYLRTLGLSTSEIDHVAGLIENYQANREEGHYEEDDKN
ncbi:hypothetical protein GCM10018980_40180 [Streptomyces capoamus]|uniref:HTH cro/C1-type domain-containing protein n=2 Tax=Streptomyces capoamus TaxID=68183 RepID=A0A919C669_9ACTN|nr:hypothetical protein GCM10010501_26010 [Streptomyces libani subsp. rufus]GHG55030.1 hypothetical protein GCM10018980_40180 [Streptomyces capoamus]